MFRRHAYLFDEARLEEVLRRLILLMQMVILCWAGMGICTYASDENTAQFVREFGNVTCESFIKEYGNVTCENFITEYPEVIRTEGGTTAYNLSDEQIEWITKIAANENGLQENALRYEVSLICNLTDEGHHGSTPYDVVNSNWFASSTKRAAARTSVPQESVEIVRDVLSGNRVSNCNEHDCFKDIVSIETNGIVYTDFKDISNRDNYLSGITIIQNKHGARYLFECFPGEGTDPFGKIV